MESDERDEKTALPHERAVPEETSGVRRPATPYREQLLDLARPLPMLLLLLVLLLFYNQEPNSLLKGIILSTIITVVLVEFLKATAAFKDERIQAGGAAGVFFAMLFLITSSFSLVNTTKRVDEQEAMLLLKEAEITKIQEAKAKVDAERANLQDQAKEILTLNQRVQSLTGELEKIRRDL